MVALRWTHITSRGGGGEWKGLVVNATDTGDK